MSAANNDTEHLGRLRDYYAENRRIPSFQRLAELMGFASKAASSKLLERLESAGFVERTPDDDAWIPGARFFERQLAQIAVRAGAPEMIDSGGGEPFLVDQYLVRQPSKTVMVPVKGDSMLDAGILLAFGRTGGQSPERNGGAGRRLLAFRRVRRGDGQPAEGEQQDGSNGAGDARSDHNRLSRQLDLPGKTAGV